MKRSLFYFAWNELIRSASMKKSIASTAVLAFIALYLSFSFLFLAFNIDKLMEESHPGINVLKAFNSIVLIYIGVDLVIRLIMQNLPTISFRQFIILPVKRSRIVRYLLFRSLIHFFNVIPLIFLIPFIFDVVRFEAPALSVLCWLTGLYILVLSNHFLAVYLKWRFQDSQAGFYIVIGVIASLFLIDYFELINLNEQFGLYLDNLIVNPQLVLLLIILPVIFYLLNNAFLNKHLYLDNLEKRKGDISSKDFSFLNKLGDYGKFISLEMRMIWRNKRPKNVFLMSVIFLLYGLLIYKDFRNEPAPNFILVLGGIFMTGIFTMSYGQFFPAWHSRYFSYLMAQNIKMKEFLQSVFMLLTTITGIFYLLSLGYVFITPKVIWVHFVVALYNIGVNNYFILYMGLFSSKPIDLDRSAFFNYQGMGAQQFLIAFPMLLGPLAFFGLLSWGLGSMAAFVIIGLISLTGIILQPLIINKFAVAYLNKKHKLIANYKKT